MDTEINVAVVGAGYWGFKLIREYLALSAERDDIKLRAVVDISQERLKEVARKLDLSEVRLLTDYKALLNNPEVNAVHIATPNETHFTIAKDFLLAEKNVLLEKPMTLSSRRAFKLARLAEINNGILLVGHIFRFNNALHKVKEILRKNWIGRVYYMDLTWTTRMPLPENRDIIFDLAPHPVDIINFLTEEWPHEVYTKAKSYVRGKEGLEETAYSIMELDNDIMAQIKLSWLEHGKKTRSVKIVGEDGTILVNALGQKVVCYKDDEVKEVPVKSNNTIRGLIEHFTNVVRGEKSPFNSALIGALVVLVLEAMKKSLKENRPVTVLR